MASGEAESRMQLPPEGIPRKTQFFGKLTLLEAFSLCWNGNRSLLGEKPSEMETVYHTHLQFRFLEETGLSPAEGRTRIELTLSRGRDVCEPVYM